MAENTLAFNFIAKDKASRTFQKLGRESDGLSKKLAGFGKVAAVALGGAAVVGVTALGAAFVKGAKDARNYQVLSAKTAAVIKSTGNVANISTKGIQKLAAGLENLSGVDEELIINSENVLATFTRVRNETGKGNDIFNQATKSALDMSVALGTDLQSSTIQLGKALNDPIKGITALSRVGVSFTKEQKEQIKVLVESGDVMGAQKLILQELTTEFGGAAEAAGKVRAPVDRAKDALSDFARDMGAKILPKIDALANWVTETGVPALEDFVAYITDTLVPDVVAGFNDLKTKVEKVLPDIDLSGIADTFFDQAKEWAASIIDGVQTGLDDGDWKPLGETIGKGLVKAVEGAGKFAVDIGKKIGDLLGEIDWVGLGIKLGKLAVPLLTGIAIGLLNFDILGLLGGLADHWQEALFAVLTVAFLPAKFIGFVGKLLAKIPFVGKLLEWALVHFKQFSDGLVGMVGRAIGAIVRAFLEGFRTKFPNIGVGFGKALALLPLRLAVVTLDIIKKAQEMMAGLAGAIGRGILGVVRKIGELTAAMLRPFANAAGWLYNAGFEILRGLKNGIVGAVKGIGNWIKRNLIDPIVNSVKSWFGIKSPSTVFAGIGGHLVGGLIKGMASTSGTAIAKRIFGDLPSALGHIVSKGLVSLAGLPGKALKALGGLAGKIGGLFGSLFGGGGGAPGNLSANAQIVKSLAAARGWTGGQWDALYKLIQGESGFRNTAQNPTSSAYGMFQFLDSTWGSVGARKTSDPYAQTLAGLTYIARAYGTPANAYSKWSSRSPHWYGAGGVISEPVFGVGRSGQSYVFGERGRETVIPGVPGMGSSRSYNINVNVPATGHPATVGAAVVDAIKEYERRSGTSWRN